MTGSVGYDIDRVRGLRHHTNWAIGGARGLTSGDPLARSALDALDHVVRVLEDHWLPAIADIEDNDPIFRLGATTSGLDAAPGLLVGAMDAVLDAALDDLWPDRDDRDRFDDMTADELADLIRSFEDPWSPFVPLDGPEMAALAAAVERRMREDDTFAERLLDAHPTSTLLATLAAEYDFDPAFVAQLLANLLLEPRPRMQPRPTDEEAVIAAMAALADHPVEALSVLHDTDVVFELADRISPDEVVGLDADTVTSFVLTAMLAPEDHPELLRSGQRALTGFVETANRPRFEEGFHPPMAAGLAVVLAAYLPTMIDDLRGNGDVYADWGDDVDDHVRLGSHEEFIDLVGALARDADALEVMLATLRTAMMESQRDDAPFSPTQVGDFALALQDAAINEGTEEELQAAAFRALVDKVRTIVGFGSGALIGRLTLGKATGKLISTFVDRGGRKVRDSIGSTSTGIDPDLSGLLRTTAELSLCETFLADPDRHRDTDEPLDESAVDDARRVLGRIERAIADGEPAGAVAEYVGDLSNRVRELGGTTHLAPLDTGSFDRLDVYDAEGDADE